jgi:hypothetical protein
VQDQLSRVDNDRLAGLESRIDRVERMLSDVTLRMSALECAGSEAPGEPVLGEMAAPQPVVAAAEAILSLRDVTGPLGLLGRTLLVVAGAYLLRALTDAGTVPAATGVSAGLAYAGIWLLRADQTGTRLPASAALHGATAVAIGFPLLWEAATRFALVGPAAAAMVLAVMTAAAFAVAWRRQLHLLAWAATVAAIVTAAGLLVQTGAVSVYSGYLVAVGIATLWLGYDCDWFGLRWPAALAADLAVLGLTSRALSGPGLEQPGTVMLIQLLLLGGYLASIALRTLALGREVIPFEVIQTPAALAVGLGGALAVVRHADTGALPLGLATLLIAGVCYAVAFAFVERRQGRGSNFYFYTSLALVLTLIGGSIVLTRTTQAPLWSGLAIVGTWAAHRFSRATLTLHSMIYLLAAATVSGLLGLAHLALLGSADVSWPAIHPTAWMVVLACAACLVAPFGAVAGEWRLLARVPRVVTALLLVIAAGGLAVSLLVPPAAGVPGRGADPGTLATVRTGVLAVAALALARLGRTSRLLELGWLMYPVLVAGGLKLVIEDFRLSRPATLFIALALYGAALIAAPRLARRLAEQQQPDKATIA